MKTKSNIFLVIACLTWFVSGCNESNECPEGMKNCTIGNGTEICVPEDADC